MPDREDLKTQPIEDREEQLSPTGYLGVTLTPDDRSKLEAWVDLHLKQIESDMAPALSRFEKEDNQLEGNMPGADHPYAGAFRVNHPVTKKKVREISNRLKQAFLDSDPIWSVGGSLVTNEVGQQVERALDDLVDHKLNILDDLSQALFEATHHGAGFIEPGWCYLEGQKRDVINYQAYDGLTMTSLGFPDPQTGEVSSPGIVQFEQDFPNWLEEKEGRRLHSLLAHGTPVEREASWTEVVKNQPEFRFIEAKNVRVYPSVNGWEGLRTTPMYGHMRSYTRFELEALAEQKTIDGDQLGRVFPAPMTDSNSARQEIESVDIGHFTLTYQLGKDKVPTRYKIWFDKKSRAILRTRHYHWWVDVPDLIVFYVRQEDPGFFKRGIAWDLTDDHVVLNVILSMYLNGVDRANSMQWKTKSRSLAEQYILAGRWSPKLPMPWKENPNEVESMAQPTRHLDHILRGFELMRRQSDEQTLTTAGQSGRESPTDPRAPATKTALLLQQVEPNTKEYVRSMESGFRIMGKWLLWLYYQGIRLGWIDQIAGVEQLPVEQLPQLAEELNPRALLFESDRNGRTERNGLAVSLVGQFAPQALPEAIKITLSQIDSQWAQFAQKTDFTPPAPAGPGGAPAAPSRLEGLVAPTNGSAGVLNAR